MAAKKWVATQGTHAVTTGTDAAYNGNASVAVIVDTAVYTTKEAALADIQRAYDAIVTADWP